MDSKRSADAVKDPANVNRLNPGRHRHPEKRTLYSAFAFT